MQSKSTKNRYAFVKLINKGDFINALLFLEKHEIDWEGFYSHHKTFQKERQGLLYSLFPRDGDLDKKAGLGARTIFQRAMDKGYSPSEDGDLLDDFFTECKRSNFKMFASVLKKNPKELEAAVWTFIDCSAAWYEGHFEHLLDPCLKNIKRNNIPFLLFMWRTHSSEYPLDEMVAENVCATTKNCLNLGFDVTPPEDGTGLRELTRMAVDFSTKKMTSGSWLREKESRVSEIVSAFWATQDKEYLEANLVTSFKEIPCKRKI